MQNTYWPILVAVRSPVWPVDDQRRPRKTKDWLRLAEYITQRLMTWNEYLLPSRNFVIEKLNALHASRTLLEIGGDECDNLNFMSFRNDNVIIHKKKSWISGNCKIRKIRFLNLCRCVCSCYTEDAMSYHVHSKFSTKDRDNDEWAECSCAKKYQAAWWYRECSESNLNGQYFKVS